MGLKTVHIVFICACIVLSFLVGAWGVQQYRLAGSTTGLGLGIVFYVTGFGLVAYGIRFVRKMREMGL